MPNNPKPTKTALIWLSDTHSNSTIGLCHPSVTLDDGNEYKLNRAQRQLWEAYLDFLAWTKDLTAGYRRVGVLGGDMVEGDTKGRSTQLMSRNQADVLKIAQKTLEPALDLFDLTIAIRGTEAHVGASGNLEEILANDITNIHKENGVSSHYHVRKVFSGVRTDLAHHTGMGGKPWTEKNAANALAALVRYEYTTMNQPEPHYVVRGHTHRWADSGENFAPLTAIIAPSWCLKTSYVYRIGGENKLSTIGGLVILCENGVGRHVRKIYEFEKARKVWATL